MSNGKQADGDQQQFWQMALETFKSSGLSVRQFCGNEGLSEPVFYSWRKRLAKADEPAAVKEKVYQPEPFIQISIPDKKPEILELVLFSGNTLKISHGTDIQTLSDVISVLHREGLC
jgi:hypothetical protein